MLFNESSLQDLYNSAVKAFPYTTLRQHATDPIKIVNMSWLPFRGMKTLFVKALAQNEGKEYNTIILFKNVKYLEEGATGVKLRASDGLDYVFEPLSLENTEVLVRCNCPDFKYRFRYYDHLNKSLYGPKGRKYEAKGTHGPANPQELPGACKHIFKTIKALRETKALI